MALGEMTVGGTPRSGMTMIVDSSLVGVMMMIIRSYIHQNLLPLPTTRIRHFLSFRVIVNHQKQGQTEVGAEGCPGPRRTPNIPFNYSIFSR